MRAGCTQYQIQPPLIVIADDMDAVRCFDVTLAKCALASLSTSCDDRECCLAVDINHTSNLLILLWPILNWAQPIDA